MQCHLPSDGVTCYQYFRSSPHCWHKQKRKRPKPLPVPMSWPTPCPPQRFPGGFSGLECSSTEMVLELERSAAESPLLMLPHTLIPPYPHWPSAVPVSSSSLLTEVAELRLNLYIIVVYFSSSSPLVDEVPFPKALRGCCSLEKVQVLIYNNDGITIFSLSWESNKRKYLFIFFPIARSQLDTFNSSLSLYFFFQCVSTRSVCLLGY